MTRAVVIAAAIMIAMPASAAASYAHWRGHVVRVAMTGQIDASPCPATSCTRGVVSVYVDGADVHDYVARCAWPRHPRIRDFSHHGYPHRWYVKVHMCGRDRWLRFR